MRFKIRLRELEAAYRAARAQAERDQKQVLDDWRALEEAVARGEASFVDTDEEGQVLYDRGEHAGELMEEVKVVLDLIRQAFTISLHHLWERELNRLMKVKYYKEANSFAYLKGEGAAVDESKLTDLRHTANVAKHSGGSSANKLHKRRPDLFDTAEMAKWSDPPSYEYLRISDQAFDEFFEAVRQSGPPRQGTWL
ncbi:hypothetical protein [Sphingomonas sanguinis]|uniref:Uncharacterized protein n=1 Tax=Sphingomonas sanguinis TaxID=33051 RepID=A0A147I756_9SPHN|nr:hypothetical protein [Sphingomonas sanguinis]KTT74847.1 hypothetical protein NS319_01155 [Sphingomonas sanguinis]